MICNYYLLNFNKLKDRFVNISLNTTDMLDFRRMLVKLTIKLLETDPLAYSTLLDRLMFVVKESKNLSFKNALKRKLCEQPYYSWYSNHLVCVVHLTGSYPEPEILYKELDWANKWYGYHLPDGIDCDLAISLIERMTECGVYINSSQGPGSCTAGMSILEILSNKNRGFLRENNEKLIDYFKQKTLPNANLTKRELLVHLQRNAPIDFLRKHHIYGNVNNIRRSRKLSAIRLAYSSFFFPVKSVKTYEDGFDVL
jgi:hypothetical protein